MRRLLILIIFLISGCAEVQQYTDISKPLGLSQSASIGAEIFRLQKTRDLPNALGKADIHGGKIDEGYSELRFMGLSQSGQIIFRFTDLDIQSNETVFTRYGSSQSSINSDANVNASAYGNTAYGRAETNTTITHYDKPEARIVQLPLNTVEFMFDPEEKKLKIENITVEIMEVKNYSITYILYSDE